MSNENDKSDDVPESRDDLDEMPLRCRVMFLMAGDNPSDEEAAFWNDWKDRGKDY